MITVEENERAEKALDVIAARELLRMCSEAAVNTILDAMIAKQISLSIAAEVLWTYAGKVDESLAAYLP